MPATWDMQKLCKRYLLMTSPSVGTPRADTAAVLPAQTTPAQEEVWPLKPSPGSFATPGANTPMTRNLIDERPDRHQTEERPDQDQVDERLQWL